MTSTAGSGAKDGKVDAKSVLAPIDMLGFAIRASGRHWRLGALIAVGITTLGLAYSTVVSQNFLVTSRILADETFNKTGVLSTPGNVSPFSGSLELLTQKSVLLSVVDNAGLVADIESRESPLMREVDNYINRIRGRDAPSLDDKRSFIARSLAKQIKLALNRDVVSIGVTWPNASKAVEIVQLLDDKFIDLLRNRDTASFSAAISILEDEARRAGEAIEPALAGAVRERDQANQPPTTVTPGGPQEHTNIVATKPPSTSNDTATQQARQYAAKLSEVNGRIQAAEDAWHQQQQSLNARLAELRTVYGPAHPQVIQQQILSESASEPPAALTDLQRTRAKLLQEIQNAPGDSSSPPNQARAAIRATSLGLGARSTAALTPGVPTENFEVTAARAKLNHAVDNFNDVQRRLEAARLQLMASQATFAMHFVVVEKPEFPPAPAKPLRRLVRVASVVAGLLFGFFAGTIRDLISGRIHEPLQLKPFGLKDLGELPMFNAPELKRGE